MSGFLYFACILTGVLSGGALGFTAGSLLTNVRELRLAAGVVGAVLLTWYLLRLGRRLQKLLNEK